MSLIATLLITAAPVPSGTALETALLAAFDQHCATLDSYGALASRIAAAGWQPFVPDAGSDLDKLVSFAAKKDDLPGWEYKASTFARGEDRTLVAIITRAGTGKPMSLECRIVALGATAAPSAATVEGWAKRATTTQYNQSRMQMWEWKPGLRPGHVSTGVAFVAHDAPIRAEFPLLGLTAQALGKGD